MIYYLLIYGIGLLLSILIARAVFSISTIVSNLETQTKLLEEISRKLNTDIKNPEEQTASKISSDISDEELEREALSYPKE